METGVQFKLNIEIFDEKFYLNVHPSYTSLFSFWKHTLANKVQKALKNIKGEYFESYFKDIMDDIKAKKCIKSEYFETYFKDIMEDIKVKSEGNA